MPPKTRPDTSGYQKLKKDLSAGTPGRLYVFHGEETYLRDYYLGKLRELILSGGMGEFNLHELAARDMSPHALEEAVDCLPMMSSRTLVMVTDYDLFKAGEKDREEYIRIFSQLPDYVCLVFLYDILEYKGDARTRLAGALKEHGAVVNFVRQDQGDLVDWVRRRFRALGKDIDSRLALESGRGKEWVASLWGLKPYPADKLMQSARRFTLPWCRRAVVLCGETDLAMKSTGQDGQELLTTLLLKLAAPAAL